MGSEDILDLFDLRSVTSAGQQRPNTILPPAQRNGGVPAFSDFKVVGNFVFCTGFMKRANACGFMSVFDLRMFGGKPIDEVLMPVWGDPEEVLPIRPGYLAVALGNVGVVQYNTATGKIVRQKPVAAAPAPKAKPGRAPAAPVPAVKPTASVKPLIDLGGYTCDRLYFEEGWDPSLKKTRALLWTRHSATGKLAAVDLSCPPDRLPPPSEPSVVPRVARRASSVGPPGSKSAQTGKAPVKHQMTKFTARFH